MKGRGAGKHVLGWVLAGAVAGLGDPVAGQDRQLPLDRALRTTPVTPQEAAAFGPEADSLAGVEIDPGLVELITRLGDPVYSTREAATAELQAAAYDNDQMYAALARLRLSAEQRHRVLSVIRHRLLTTPRGAVGVKVDRRWLPDKVIIEELLPDLPAREVLQPGDQITHLQGRPLESWEAFVESVQSQPPGTRITITVERLVSGRRPHRLDVGNVEAKPKLEVLEVELELGSAEKLRDPETGRPQSGGPVALQRKREAELATVRFGGEPRLLDVDER